MNLPETLHPAVELFLRIGLGAGILGSLSILLLNSFWGLPIGGALGALFLYYGNESRLPSLGRPKRRSASSKLSNEEGSKSRSTGVNTSVALRHECPGLLNSYIEKFGGSLQEAAHRFDQLKMWLAARTLQNLQTPPTAEMDKMWRLFMENQYSYETFCEWSFTHIDYVPHVPPITGKRLRKDDVVRLMRGAQYLHMASSSFGWPVDDALWFDHDTLPKLDLRPQSLYNGDQSDEALKEEMRVSLQSIKECASIQPVFNEIVQEVQELTDATLPSLLESRSQAAQLHYQAKRAYAIYVVMGISTPAALKAKQLSEKKLKDIEERISTILTCVAEETLWLLANAHTEMVNLSATKDVIKRLQESGRVARASIQETEDFLNSDMLSQAFDNLQTE